MTGDSVPPPPPVYRAVRFQIEHYPNATFKKWRWETTDGLWSGRSGWSWTQEKAERAAQQDVEEIIRRRKKRQRIVVESRVIEGTE